MYIKLKAAQLEFRKKGAEGKAEAAILTGLIGDVDAAMLKDRKVAEAKGEEFIPSDGDVMKVLKNNIKNLSRGVTDIESKVGECEQSGVLKQKITFIEQFLPEAVEGDDLRYLLQSLEASNMGMAMKALREQAEAQGFNYDGKEAAEIAKGLFI